MKTKVEKFAVPAIFAAALGAFAVLAPANITANANTGPSRWQGVTASGTVFTGENCPVEVEGEVLTFDIQHFINHYSSDEEMQNYSANFSAEYTFKNPTQDAVEATLAFPLGSRSYYSCWVEGENGKGKQVALEDLLAEKGMYSVSVDGERIDAEMRYTFHSLYDFDFSTESKRIVDGFKEHEFFSPDMPVYKYAIGFLSEQDGFYADVTLNNAVEDIKNVRFAGNFGSLIEEGGKTEISYYVRNKESVELYSIGGELNLDNLEWSFYQTVDHFGLIKKKVDAEVVYSDVVKEQKITFKEYVFNGNTVEDDLSEQEAADLYNAILDYTDEYYSKSLLPVDFSFLSDSDYLMRWLVYKLDFGAGQTIKNTVTAPVIPGGYYNYEPFVYSYSYLLSPASQWSSFKNLEIRINTPYYIVNSSFEFEKTDYGYVYKSDVLPVGELNFILCSVENPSFVSVYGDDDMPVALIIFLVLVYATPIILGIAFIVFVIVFASRYKKKNPGKNLNGSFKPLNYAGEDEKNKR